MKIYLDVCSYNRPFDNLLQDRVRLEAEAVMLILKHCDSGDWVLVGSDVVDLEVSKIKNPLKKEKVIECCKIAKKYITTNEDAVQRSVELQRFGFDLFDSMHIALAEEARADVLISTDDKMINLTKRLNLKVKVANPINWLLEVL